MMRRDTSFERMKSFPPIQNPAFRLFLPVLLVIANILCFACLVLFVLRLL